MERLGYYLKPGARASAPGVLFSVVVTPSIERAGLDERDVWYSWGGAEVCVSHYIRGAWSRRASTRCETPSELYQWMEVHGNRSRRNYVICPDGQEAAATGQLWDHLDNKKVWYTPAMTPAMIRDVNRAGDAATCVRRCVTSPRTFILDYMRAGWRWLWLSGAQFFDAGDEALAKSIEWTWPDTHMLESPGATVVRTPRERCALWLRLFEVLSDWWLTHSKAPFALTGSGLSMGMLRTHVRPRAICSHTDPDVLALERAACIGGRAQTWYFGDIGSPSAATFDGRGCPPPSEYGSISGPMYHLDVRSMYPFLLREMEYPRKLKEYRENMTASEPQQLARSMGVIARVTIETERDEYPERVGDRVYYRIGRFTTTLTGPELLALAQDGRVRTCHACAVYHMGRPYRETAAALIAMREAARADGRLAWELFAKLLGNGLGGKLAQRRGEWIARPDVSAPVRFGEWYDAGCRGGRRGRYRAVAGMVWEWVPDATGAGRYTAGFAHLCAYGRLHMRSIRDGLPERSVLSMDTDGLWVRSDGYDAIEVAAAADDVPAGALRLVAHSGSGRFLGPRHYLSDAGWVLSGFTAKSPDADSITIHDLQRSVGRGTLMGTAPRGIHVRSRTSRLAIDAPGVAIGLDGWTRPKRRR